MKLSSKKLADLHEYFVNGGSTDFEDVAAKLGTEDEEVCTAYVDALKKKYPEIYGDEPKYLLVDEATGLTKELELTKTKGNKHFLAVVEPKDIVEILVGGETLEVDLVKLRKRKGDERVGGHLVSTLILAAELAKVQ